MFIFICVNARAESWQQEAVGLMYTNRIEKHSGTFLEGHFALGTMGKPFEENKKEFPVKIPWSIPLDMEVVRHAIGNLFCCWSTSVLQP